MANPYYVSPPNILESLMMGQQGFDSARQRTRQGDVDTARQQAAQLGASGDYRGALAALLQGGDVQGAGIYGGLLERQLGRSADANSVYGNTFYVKRPDGTLGLATHDKQGKVINLDTGQNQIVEGIRPVDFGTSIGLYGARSGTLQTPGGAPSVPGQAPPAAVPQPQGQVAPGMTSPTPMAGQQQPGFIPKDVAGEARQKKIGGEEGDRIASFGKAKSALDSGIATLNEIEKDAKRLLTHPGLNGILGLQGAVPNLPGTASSNAQATLDSLLAKGGFSELQKMRDNSPTGGALGQVAVAEHTLLRDAFARLQRTQGTPQFKEALADVIQKMGESKLRMHGAFKQDFERLRAGDTQGAAKGPVNYLDYFKAKQ